MSAFMWFLIVCVAAIICAAILVWSFSGDKNKTDNYMNNYICFAYEVKNIGGDLQYHFRRINGNKKDICFSQNINYCYEKIAKYLEMIKFEGGVVIKNLDTNQELIYYNINDFMEAYKNK